MMQRVKIGMCGFVVAASLILVGAAWEEVYQNLLLKGMLFVGTGTPSVTQAQGSIFASGTLEVGEADTLNATSTFNGVVKIENRQNGRISWLTTHDPAAGPLTVSGLNLGTSDYSVFLTPTANITPLDVTVVDADSFTVQITTVPTTNVSQAFLVVPADY